MSQATLPIIIARYRHRLRRIVESVRRAQYADMQARQQAEIDELDYQKIRGRAEAAEKPSKLALELQRRLLERERAVVEDPNAPADEVDKMIEVTLDDDEDEDEDEEDIVDEGEVDDGEVDEGEVDGDEETTGADPSGQDDVEMVDAEGLGLEEELEKYNDEGSLDEDVAGASEALDDDEDDEDEDEGEVIADKDVDMREAAVDEGVDVDTAQGGQDQEEQDDDGE